MSVSIEGKDATIHELLHYRNDRIMTPSERRFVMRMHDQEVLSPREYAALASLLGRLRELHADHRP